MITAYNPQVAAAKQGWILLENVQYSHPQDWFLSHVLCFHPVKHEYVVWIFNAQTGGFGGGDYHKNVYSAVECFKRRTGEKV